VRKAFGRSKLAGFHKRVESGKRLNRDEAVAMAAARELFPPAEMAGLIRDRFNGNGVYVSRNAEIALCNICRYECKFCSFRRTKGETGAFDLKPSRVVNEVKHAVSAGARHVRLVGAVSASRKIEAYESLLKRIKAIAPELCIEACSPPEIIAMSEASGKTSAEALIRLKEAGLGIVSGLGADVFAKGFRDANCPDKPGAAQWREVMADASRIGLPCAATILYGFGERTEQLVDHLIELRKLQERTRNILSLTPIPYVGPSGVANDPFLHLRMISLCRTILANVAHIQIPFRLLGGTVSQMGIVFGADALDVSFGTTFSGNVATFPDARDGDGDDVYIARLIAAIGRRLVENDGLFDKSGPVRAERLDQSEEEDPKTIADDTGAEEHNDAPDASADDQPAVPDESNSEDEGDAQPEPNGDNQ